ncbi:sialidase-like [Scaptodrosophila lebanonensis]|uniref:Sialidase-like n=1 Tax=Drosophila lebanonensis TaxID=7225 RepID=A0A6J2T4Z4_DROLE|nr:sialidase-like [Scaptodrosophila lebanonensis]
MKFYLWLSIALAFVVSVQGDDEGATAAPAEPAAAAAPADPAAAAAPADPAAAAAPADPAAPAAPADPAAPAAQADAAAPADPATPAAPAAPAAQSAPGAPTDNAAPAAPADAATPAVNAATAATSVNDDNEENGDEEQEDIIDVVYKPNTVPADDTVNHCGTCSIASKSALCGYNGHCFAIFKNECAMSRLNCKLRDEPMFLRKVNFGDCTMTKVKKCAPWKLEKKAEEENNKAFEYSRARLNRRGHRRRHIFD